MTSADTLRIYQLDAFTDHLFAGNPAAVVPLTTTNTWLPDAQMQAIAAENNLAETAFYIRTATGYHIRWFTPTVEVDPLRPCHPRHGLRDLFPGRKTRRRLDHARLAERAVKRMSR